MTSSAARQQCCDRATGAVILVSRNFRAFAWGGYLAAASQRIGEAFLHNGPLYELRSNNLTQYFVNYIDHGFAKRAFIGTLLRPLTTSVEHPETVVFLVMVVVNVCALIALISLVQALLPHREGDIFVSILRCAVAVGSLGLVQVAHDYGRYDLINYFVLVLALWLARRSLPIVSALFVAIGILIHEGFAIYGAPLVIAASWHFFGGNTAPVPAALRCIPLVLATALTSVAIFLFGNSDSAAQLTVGSGAYVWQRGTFDMRWPDSRVQAAILIAYWAALLALMWHVFQGRRAFKEPLFYAALSPLALNLFGIDMGRWLAIAFVVFVISVTLQRQALGTSWPPMTRPTRYGAFLLCLPLGPHGLTGVWTWFF